jgi:hypothetical protein
MNFRTIIIFTILAIVQLSRQSFILRVLQAYDSLASVCQLFDQAHTSSFDRWQEIKSNFSFIKNPKFRFFQLFVAAAQCAELYR